MKNILVPVDFSSISDNALEFAIKIAQALNSRIVLFHNRAPVLITSDTGAFMYSETDQQAVREISDKMDKLASYVSARRVVCEKVIQKGPLIEDITDVVEEEHIDLVVTGTHGAHGLEAILFGTHSTDILKKVKCPVLIVPALARYRGIEKIMYATDFQYGDIEEIKKVGKLAEKFEAEIIVTHINTDPTRFKSEEETIEWFAEIADANIGYNNIIYKLVYHEQVLDGLQSAMESMDVDMLCMAEVKSGFFKRIVTKSLTKEMAFHTNIPLLVLHLTDENKLNR